MAPQLNWLARYLPLKQRLEGERSLLEVGSGTVGLACVTDAPFVGLETVFDGQPVKSLRAVQYSGGRFPFGDAAFSTVVSMDTLEHVPPDARATFVHELCRVAGERVLLGCPVGEAGRAADATLAELFGQGPQAPAWLREHAAFGLPEEAEVQALLAAAKGFRVERLPAVGSLACLLVTLADVLPAFAAHLKELRPTEHLALEKWLAQATFGPAFRQVYALERKQPARGKVTASEPASIVAALQCPGCRGEVTLSEEGRGSRQSGLDTPGLNGLRSAGAESRATRLACAKCGAAFTIDARGVWHLEAAVRPVTFVMRPDWLHSDEWVVPVHNFLRAFKATDAPKLWLQVNKAVLTAETALQLLQPVLAPLGPQPFAELVLADDPTEAPPASPHVEVPGDRPSAAWTVAAFRGHATGSTP